LTPFYGVAGGYGAVWEAPEIEAFAGLAAEILPPLRAVMERGVMDRGDGTGRTEMERDGMERAEHADRKETKFGGENRLADDDAASAATDTDTDNRDPIADAEILASLDFTPAGDLAKQFDVAAGAAPTFINDNAADFSATRATPDITESPLIKRLLPPASKFDAGVAKEFRYLAQTEIAKNKAENLELFIRLLLEGARRNGRIIVQKEQAQAVAAALTDFRLAVATELGIKDEADAQRLDAEAMRWSAQAQHGNLPTVASDYQFLASVYLVAGLAQESLVQAMLADLE
jgi:hypothetical protein